MKYAKKMKLVPYYDNDTTKSTDIKPNENVEAKNNIISAVSTENFDEILYDNNLSNEQKIKLYLAAYAKYRDKYHPSKTEKKNSYIINQLSDTLKEYIDKSKEIEVKKEAITPIKKELEDSLSKDLNLEPKSSFDITEFLDQVRRSSHFPNNYNNNSYFNLNDSNYFDSIKNSTAQPTQNLLEHTMTPSGLITPSRPRVFSNKNKSPDEFHSQKKPKKSNVNTPSVSSKNIFNSKKRNSNMNPYYITDSFFTQGKEKKNYPINE